MSVEQELFESAGVGAGTGQNPVNQESTNQSGLDRQTDQAQQGQPAKINLQELPEFKEYQQSFDRRYETLRQQATRKEQEMAARLSQYEQQLETLATRDLDDVGKRDYEIQKLRRQNELLLEQQREQVGRQRVFNRIAQVAQAAGYSVMPEALVEAQDADHAWELAFKQIAASLPKQVEARLEKREANAVDIGGGAASGIGAELQSKYERAVAHNNVSAVLDIMNEADMRNVRLRL